MTVFLLVLIVVLIVRVYQQDRTIKGHRETITQYKSVRHGSG
jgi:hypothetical protein